ncbi:MAG TPA: hypothetical protein VFG18_06335 [Xanthomonadaceae bacterium]|nr:hypothetical protein [Xanthomonadaceae bacterium]
MRAVPLCGLMLLLSPAFAWAATCPPAGAVASPTAAGTAPLSPELAFEPQPLGAPAGVLSQAYEASLSVDQVLLRQEIARCSNLAKATPAPGVDATDPAAYKPRTQYDNTPWRFNMSQDGKKMTADEFSAWMEARGVRVARGAQPATAPAADGQPAATEAPAQPLPPPPPADDQPKP